MTSFWQTSLLFFISEELIVIMAIVAIVLMFKKHLLFHSLILATLCTLLICLTLKNIIPIERPYIASSANTPLIAWHDGSFPSLHTALAFTVAVVIYLYYPAMGHLFFILALLTGFGRVATGAHYPIDVVFGGIIGLISGIFITRWVTKRWSK